MRVDGGIERGVNALVDEDDERLLLAAIEIFGDEGVAVKQDGIGGAGSLLVFDVLVGRAGVLVFVDLGDVAELLIPEEIVDAFEDDVGVAARLRRSACALSAGAGAAAAAGAGVRAGAEASCARARAGERSTGARSLNVVRREQRRVAGLKWSSFLEGVCRSVPQVRS